MAFFPDLTPYAYPIGSDKGIALNVGWLSNEHPYPQGDVPEEFVRRLWLYCKVPVNRTRGFSNCELSSQCPWPVTAEMMGEKLRLGSAEIRVLGKDSVIFAAPDMIFHYVTVHHYCPPDVFIRAVLQGYLPDSAEYLAAKEKYGW
jgi:hypothetical protein